MKVSVVLITYNHAAYIAEALDGVLLQRVDFPMEILISEDCSTDGTRDIIREYAARHPDIIRLLLSRTNLNTNAVFTRALSVARGEYIATLDGDDFWTSPDKLQRQVRFLDEHTSCTVSFHQVGVLHPDGHYDEQPYTTLTQRPFSTIADLWQDNFIASCSAMFRRASVQDLPAWYGTAVFGDWPLYLLAAQHGSVGYIPETMATYRHHGRGLWSCLTRTQQLEATLSFLRQMHSHFPRRYRSDIRRRARDICWDLLTTGADNRSRPGARLLLRNPFVARAVLANVPRRGLLTTVQGLLGHDG